MVDISSMKNPSFVLQKIKQVDFEERPIPEIKEAHEVKVEVKKTGICGSDIHYYVHGAIGDFIVTDPLVLGHESAGIIVEVGSAVKDLKVGDRVALEPGVPDRYSQEYKEGNYNLDPDVQFAATPPCDGTLAKYYVLPADFCVKLTDNMTLEDGALVEPTSVAVHAARLCNLQPGSTVAVFGCGPVGVLNIAVAKAYGAAKVIGIDVSESRLEMAKKLGADYTYQAKNIPARDAAKEIEKILGEQPEYVLECSGAPPSVNVGIYLIKMGGKFVQVGVTKPDVEIPLALVGTKELTIYGSFRYKHGDYKLAAHFIGSGKVDAKQIVTDTVPFEKAEEAYQLVMSGKAMKVMIDGPK